jgi:hypothetical protein
VNRYYLLETGGAADVAGSTDADVDGSGELAGGVLPPHATTKPVATVTARSTTSAILFMMFSPWRGGCREGVTSGLMPEP